MQRNIFPICVVGSGAPEEKQISTMELGTKPPVPQLQNALRWCEEREKKFKSGVTKNWQEREQSLRVAVACDGGFRVTYTGLKIEVVLAGDQNAGQQARYLSFDFQLLICNF